MHETHTLQQQGARGNAMLVHANRGDLDWCVSKMFPGGGNLVKFRKSWNENSKRLDGADRQEILWEYDLMTALAFIWELLSDVYKTHKPLTSWWPLLNILTSLKGNPPTARTAWQPKILGRVTVRVWCIKRFTGKFQMEVITPIPLEWGLWNEQGTCVPLWSRLE